MDVTPSLSSFSAKSIFDFMRIMSEQAAALGDGKRRMVEPTGFALVWHNFQKSLTTPVPYLTVVGLALWIFTYWLLCEGLEIWRFSKIPGPVTVLSASACSVAAAGAEFECAPPPPFGGP